ncbi:3-(3-hydroxyphenyl)propionate hydroxylase [Amycolatopsis thailandensis]|uniref:3-(3-hydroxyphenyl)propionate hydroxylase n=1 Tax=Amycolatopsis thailandensis TaxID=589330 RepID=A0A229S1A5_9PSEU|nr:FAD-dependent monooxygenase [Amycolatopsis thailandensis]OXM52690.1 3-(3-hydroxyphenyl)propionate hydroxylase [Amycolatopsis thailandensis]
MDTEVLVVGAGPTGMTLTNELLLAGVPAVLADRLPQRSDLSKAGGVQSRTLEAFDQRGLLKPLLDNGNYPTSAGHFAGVPFSPEHAGHRLPWRSVPQVVIEGFLERHLAAQGLHVRRDHELIGLAQDEDGVTATFAGGTTVRCRYLVAADGAHSTVRSLLRAGFPGKAGTATVIAADVRLSGADQVMSHTWNDDGDWVALFALGTDPQGRELRRLVVGGPGRSVPRDVPITEEEIRDGLRRVYGSRVELLELRYARRITNAARQVEHYRHGRVFLAGDAAHVHLPLGAQGMNTGIQDALNLGWKLGGAVHGWAPGDLLDTYHSERHLVGAAVLRNVQAQSLLMDWAGTRDPEVLAAKELFAAMTRLPEVQRHLGDLLSGMAITYPMPGSGSHPLVGRAAPDADLGPVRAHELLRSGRGVLIDPGDRFAKVADLWPDRVDRAGQGADTEPMLIRPDGYVCWAGDPDDLEAALGRWFGAPR